MPKDSQIDKKEVRSEKSNGQATIAEEGLNHNPNSKKQSVKKEV